MNSDEAQKIENLEQEQPPKLEESQEQPIETLNSSDMQDVPSVMAETIAEAQAVEEALTELIVQGTSIAEETITPESVAETLTVETPVAEETITPEFVAEAPTAEASENKVAEVEARVAELQHQEEALQQEIARLQASYNQMQRQIDENQATLGRLVQEALGELEQRKQALQISVEQLERRRDRIREEMRKTFAGVSQDLAIRVQGFKDYLVGSLQDLAAAAEELELPTAPEPIKVEQQSIPMVASIESKGSPTPQFTEQSFQKTAKQIRNLIDQYRTTPDYYGPPWQLRRTFEPVHAERVSNWFFNQGGRGAIRSMGSRLQNILITSAVISILYELYGDRLRPLILANSPERLGEWRRGLQDCLGITRTEFGPERGIVLFEDPEPLVAKAERLTKQKQMPLIMIDETENEINLSLLQFPLWLAFAPDPQQMSADFRF